MAFRWLLAIALALAPAYGCRSDDVAIPPASDPDGKDLVEGAVVAAIETDGRYRLYKIIHLDGYPQPIGTEYHMIAYDPPVRDYREAAALYKRGSRVVALPHVWVRQVHFMPRDHRVIAVEPVSKEEYAIYERSRR